MNPDLLQSNRRSGSVRIDAFESAASWEPGGGESLVVKFDREQLTPDKLTQLQRFRAGTPAIELQLADAAPRKAVIVAYAPRDHTLYLTWL
jgi:hypothetical protein